MVGTKVYRTAFSGILSSGGLLHSDWLPPNRVIVHYHKVDLISTLLDALIVQNAPLSPELAAGSHWKWMTSGHFDALTACGVNACLGAFDLKQRCAEWSPYYIKVLRERFECIGSDCFLIALAVLWCHTVIILQALLQVEHASFSWYNVLRLAARALWSSADHALVQVRPCQIFTHTLKKWSQMRPKWSQSRALLKQVVKYSQLLSSYVFVLKNGRDK